MKPNQSQTGPKPTCRGAAFLFLRVLIIVLLLTTTPTGFAASDQNLMCGTYPGRVITELALHRKYANQRVQSGYLPQAEPSDPTVDDGNIAVIPDDGTMVLPINTFDLDQRSLTLAPSQGGYTVTADAANMTSAGDDAVLINDIGDDGTREVPIGFPFPFFDNTYTSVFINSDGNLTFGQGDTATSERSLARFLGGSPRVAPYFADMDPSSGGRLTYSSSATRFIVTWDEVPEWARSGRGPAETFQVILSFDGAIQFSYAGIRGNQAVVGISPGTFYGVPNLADLSQTTGEAYAGPLAEVFMASTKLDVAAVAQRFFRAHEDAYDYLVIASTFDFDMNGALAYEINVQNQVTGIGHIASQIEFNYSADFGSPSHLQSVINLGDIRRYPVEPSTVFFRGVDSALSVLAHESGHRFLAYATYETVSGESRSNGLLGRDLQHWSFLFNSDASVNEGNRISDNGDGTFTTTAAVQHYSDLDQYLMGLRAPEEVLSTFVVDPDVRISPSRSPALNVTFPGTRTDVSVWQIIASNGPRLPPVEASQKDFKYAFILVTSKGAAVPDDQVRKFDALRQAFERFFPEATSYRATADTTLVAPATQAQAE
ncbi:MAG: hypothetical protein HYX72_08295 [Acidobacteria bacterium]|nr:hypothetical protein [Acidobacteriota bacterium]